MKRKRIPALLAALCLPLLTVGCGEPKHSVEVVIRNITEYTINEINLTQQQDTKNRSYNILDADFPDHMNIRYEIGSFTDEELAAGFFMHVISTGNFDDSFGKLQLADGDKITLYEDKTGLSIAINKEDVEVAALKAKALEENRDLPPVD